MKKNLLSLLLMTGIVYAAEPATNNMIDISGLDKKIVLQKLFERAVRLGMTGCAVEPIKYPDMDWSESTLEKYLAQGYINTIQNRFIGIDFSQDVINTKKYNRHNGEGVAEQVIEECARLIKSAAKK